MIMILMIPRGPINCSCTQSISVYCPHILDLIQRLTRGTPIVDDLGLYYICTHTRSLPHLQDTCYIQLGKTYSFSLPPLAFLGGLRQLSASCFVLLELPWAMGRCPAPLLLLAVSILLQSCLLLVVLFSLRFPF